MENRFVRLTGIIWGTSEEGMRIALKELETKGAAVALFDREVGTAIVDLASKARVGNQVGGVAFFEHSVNPNPESVEELKRRAEAHFGIPMSQLVNALEAPISETHVLAENLHLQNHVL